MLRTKGRRKKPTTQILKHRYRVNQYIKKPQVFVIDESGESLGVMDTRQALGLAEEKGLDLIEVSPKAEPPVCKILNYGQFQYQQSRKSQGQKVKKVDLKGLRISFKIGQHDLDMRLKQAIKFLSKGDKVKVEMILRGREKKYTAEAVEKLLNFIKTIQTETELTVEQAPKRQGGQIFAVIAPIKK